MEPILLMPGSYEYRLSSQGMKVQTKALGSTVVPAIIVSGRVIGRLLFSKLGCGMISGIT
jgi:hypothetical protein